MSRLTDAFKNQNIDSLSETTKDSSLPPLPVVDWKSIGNKAPVIIPFPLSIHDPNAPLPKADIVVITWTGPEWSAFDHVFCNSGSPRDYYDTTWDSDWMPYTRNAPPPPPPPATNYNYWGYYRMVEITGQSGKQVKVLLFKSQTHLAHPPYLPGLIEMTKAILTETGASYLYSIGTAGGASEIKDTGLLGNTMITNSGHLQMTLSQNKSPLNDQTYTCKSWFPGFDLMEPVRQQLLYPLSNVAFGYVYEKLFLQLKNYIAYHYPTIDMSFITVDDLVNKPLDPANLHNPQTFNCKDFPLLTTDYYYIASPGDGDKYCILEMDDSVLGEVAGSMNVNYAFVRNVSDTYVPFTTKSGKTIPGEVQSEWSSVVYGHFGFYTSYNGALSTWATIAAM